MTTRIPAKVNESHAKACRVECKPAARGAFRSCVRDCRDRLRSEWVASNPSGACPVPPILRAALDGVPTTMRDAGKRVALDGPDGVIGYYRTREAAKRALDRSACQVDELRARLCGARFAPAITDGPPLLRPAPAITEGEPLLRPMPLPAEVLEAIRPAQKMLPVYEPKVFVRDWITADRDVNSRGRGSETFRMYSLPRPGGERTGWLWAEGVPGNEGSDGPGRLPPLGIRASERRANVKHRMPLPEGTLRKSIEKQIGSSGGTSIAVEILSREGKWEGLEARQARSDGQFVTTVTMPDGRKVRLA